MRGSPSRRRLTGMLPRAPMAAGGRAGRRIHWRAAPVLQPRGAPAAQGSRTHQQRRQTGCSRTVPFTELSRLIGKGTITGISPDSTTIHPPKKGGGVKKKKKKGRAFLLFLFPSNPAFNQKNKAWYFVCRLGKHKGNFNSPQKFT